ncbi:hypothetical protein EPN44_01205 [bacterium]|nr:MAG: hypothetical protein EPN44_01205 [bacterium]
MTSRRSTLLRTLVQIDRTQISLATGVRNAIGVLVPLLWGDVTGHLLAGLVVSIGALNVAFSDQLVPVRHKAIGMLLATVAAAISVFVGISVGPVGWLAVGLSGLWGFAGGLLVAFGPAAAQLGLTSVLLMLIMAGWMIDPRLAAGQAGLVVLGGLLQTLLSIVPWPFRRFELERSRLADVYRELAQYAEHPATTTVAPPLGAVFARAREALMAASGERFLIETFWGLLDEAERIRLELLTLGGLLEQFGAAGDVEVTNTLHELLGASSAALSPCRAPRLRRRKDTARRRIDRSRRTCGRLVAAPTRDAARFRHGRRRAASRDRRTRGCVDRPTAGRDRDRCERRRGRRRRVWRCAGRGKALLRPALALAAVDPACESHLALGGVPPCLAHGRLHRGGGRRGSRSPPSPRVLDSTDGCHRAQAGVRLHVRSRPSAIGRHRAGADHRNRHDPRRNG